MTLLEIRDLHASCQGKKILKGINMKVSLGKINAIMGPNGSGKSTLAHIIMGNPKYQVTKGCIIYDKQDITNLKPDERARKGVFLSFQYPYEIFGVTVSNFLRTALNTRREEPINVMEFKKLLENKMEMLHMDKKFMLRYLNEGFSGGEKKKAEILQMLVLDPRLAILDETDSGLDIDSLKHVAKGVNAFMNKDKCLLIITHYQRILNYIEPDELFIIIDGRVALSGKGDMVHSLEEKGYAWIQKQ